jgi:hypothetical protein
MEVNSMAWYKSTSTKMPTNVDDSTSKKWVYVRRNIEKVEQENVFTHETETYYSFEETKIPKEVYMVFEAEKSNSERLNDIEEALVELIYGGE